MLIDENWLGKRMKRRELVKLGVLTLLVVAAGCGMQPYEPPNNREYPAGPGILSGKDGEFVIYRKQEPAAEPPGDEAAAEETSAGHNEGSEQPQ